MNLSLDEWLQMTPDARKFKLDFVTTKAAGLG